MNHIHRYSMLALLAWGLLIAPMPAWCANQTDVAGNKSATKESTSKKSAAKESAPKKKSATKQSAETTGSQCRQIRRWPLQQPGVWLQLRLS